MAARQDKSGNGTSNKAMRSAHADPAGPILSSRQGALDSTSTDPEKGLRVSGLVPHVHAAFEDGGFGPIISLMGRAVLKLIRSGWSYAAC